MVENFIRIVLAGFVIALPVIWIISLAKWDGKCHCDKTQCRNCPYYGNCEHQNMEDKKK